MDQLQRTERGAMRLACRAARDAVDARCAALTVTWDYDSPLRQLARLAPRLRSLANLHIECLAQFSDYDRLGAALGALPNPALLTRLKFGYVDACALGADRDAAARLAAVLARFTALRSVALRWLISIDDLIENDDDSYGLMGDLAAAALSVLRRLPALAELFVDLELLGEDEGEESCPLYTNPPPRGAGLLPWRTLERLTLVSAGAPLLLPALTQEEVAPQLTRLRALSIALSGRPAELLEPLTALWRAPWLRQLTSLRLMELMGEHGEDSDGAATRAIFDALPAADGGGGGARGAPLMPALQELTVWNLDYYDYDGRRRTVAGADGLRRLLGACMLGALRRLVLRTFDGARGVLAARASELTALTELDLGSDAIWRAAEAGAGGGGGGDGNEAALAAAAARVSQLAAFLQQQGAGG